VALGYAELYQDDDDDCSWDLPDHRLDVADWMSAVRAAVEALPGMEEREWRYVNHLDLWGTQPYHLLFTGGQFWGGDEPALYGHFEAILSCTPLLNRLATWAREDKRAKPPAAYSPDGDTLPEAN
jgi:hypothetical protein